MFQIATTLPIYPIIVSICPTPFWPDSDTFAIEKSKTNDNENENHRDRNFSYFTKAPSSHFGNGFTLEAQQVVYAVVMRFPETFVKAEGRIMLLI